jgi:predicted ABC-type ATPase
VKLLFLSLRTPEEAIARVALRVQQGGHDVAAEVIRRRFASGLKNFMDVYRYEVDYWRLFDNSGPSPLLLSQGVIDE